MKFVPKVIKNNSINNLIIKTKKYFCLRVDACSVYNLLLVLTFKTVNKITLFSYRHRHLKIKYLFFKKLHVIFQ